MARHKICLIHGHDAELLSRGVVLNCREHLHIDRSRAQLLVSGAGLRPWLDQTYSETGRNRASDAQISERHDSTAFWARLDDGTLSSRYLVLASARAWQVLGGSMQYLPLGSTKQGMKRGKTHFRPRRRDRRGPVHVICQAICRPTLLRSHTA